MNPFPTHHAPTLVSSFPLETERLRLRKDDGFDAIVVLVEKNSDSSLNKRRTFNWYSQKALLESLLGATGVDLGREVAKWPEFTAKAGEILEIPTSRRGGGVSSWFVVGVGSAKPSEFRDAATAIGRRFRTSGRKILHLGLHPNSRHPHVDRSSAIAHLVALPLSQYSWNQKSDAPQSPSEISIIGAPEEFVSHANNLSTAVWRARNLIHTPANVKSPQWLANQVSEFVKSEKSSRLKVKIRSGSEIERFGGLIAVGNSAPKRGPRFIEVTYTPGGSAKVPHVVLVGKGIVFDTGGVSLKRPYDSMVAMKSDMAGVAAIAGVMSVLPRVQPKVKVTALLMCAENALSATAQRPSDVITQYGGTTVEVINTDAEGRLVLADGLAYADLELDPDYLIDVATLTGAATHSLTRNFAPVYSRNGALLHSFTEIGEWIGERVWHMPLIDEYAVALESEVADIRNSAEHPNFGAGSVTAALFLERFVGARNWVHFDIAGPGRSDADNGENVKGGTGFGARLLTEWISQL